MIRQFGGEITVKGKEIQITGPQSFVGQEVIVPGDISSAAFFLTAGAVLPNSEITLENVGINPTRTGILDVLEQMGAQISPDSDRSEQSISYDYYSFFCIKRNRDPRRDHSSTH